MCCVKRGSAPIPSFESVAHVGKADAATLAFAGNHRLAIVSTAQDLRPDEQRPPVRAVSLEATLTVTEYAG